MGEMANRLMKLEIEINELDMDNRTLESENSKLKALCQKLDEENKRPVKYKSAVISPVKMQKPGLPRPSKLKSNVKFQKHVTRTQHNRSYSRSNPPSPEEKKSCLNNSFEVGTSPDGKSFFNIIKTRLSSEEFREFIINLKNYKSKIFTRPELMEKTKLLFGTRNKDLLDEFGAVMFVNLQ